MFLTNVGQKVTKILPKDEFGGVFDGVFTTDCREDEVEDLPDTTFFEVANEKIADNGDSDFDYDKTIAFLKKSYSTLTNEEIDVLYELTAEDKGIQDVFDDDLTNIPFLPAKYKKAYDSREELSLTVTGDVFGDIGWECQNIRGLIAKDQGFDAVSMNDEYGTSYFIPYGTKAKIL